MPSTHAAAGNLVHQERLFNNLSSFRELEQRIQALHDQNTKSVGDAFEIFIEAYLATQVTFQAEKVWIVGKGHNQGQVFTLAVPHSTKNVVPDILCGAASQKTQSSLKQISQGCLVGK